MARKSMALADYQALVGQEVGVSDWTLVDQAMIDVFAQATGDHQFIHVDPVRAAATPFGTTIAHGYLTLSLLPVMAYSALPGIAGTKMGVNYGHNKVRFMAPVKSGSRVRGRFTLTDVTIRKDGSVQSTVDVAVEIEGSDKPALIAEWLTLAYI
ncbi:MAG: MaoC family dehydratase [Polymorphobacter sp.]